MSATMFRRQASKNLKKFRLKFELPEKWKGGKLEKIGEYMKNILGDYKTVAVETKEEMKKRPFKTAVYASCIGAIIGLIKTNPSERSFREKLLENTNDLMLLGDAIRNPMSDNHMQMVMKYYNEGRLRRLNLGICSLMYFRDFPDDVDLYEAQCDHLKPKYKDFKNYVIDIGFLGNWMALHNMMKDYDINPSEWESESPGKK